ncbi:MAG TPA: DUF1656 domain-containing protein [Stellaceae bacterium]|jgi:hypothetical protein|nr:DUF1656 domain-containing protein [Stellaceae bacterium]
MIGEIDLYGVFVSPLLMWMVIALPLTAILRRVLARVGLYRFVWHRPLFDLALLVMMIGAVNSLSSLVPTSSLWPFR